MVNKTPIRIQWNTRLLEADVNKDMTRNMKRATRHMVKVIRKSINRRNPTGKNPSLPGEPPKRVSGNLWRSIYTEIRQTAKLIIAEIGHDNRAFYGLFLEFGWVGTDSNGRNVVIQARPFLRPAIKKERDNVIAIMLGDR